jgi:hypothetical protein
MNRLLKAAAALCLLAVPAFASNTTYTATVTDTDGQKWLNGTWNALLTLPSGPFGNVKPTVGGVPVPISAKGVLDANGVMTVNVTNPQSLDQTGGVWNITVCPNSSVSSVADTGCVTVPIKDTGGDMTARFTGLKAPRFPAGENAFGYNDGEVIPPAVPGVQYYNTSDDVTKQGLRVWDGKQWNGVGGGGGGGGIPPAGADTELQSKLNTSALGRTGIYVDNATTPTVTSFKIPRGLYTYNSNKTNSQYGGIDTYSDFHLCQQDAVAPNSNGTNSCQQYWSDFYAPGNNTGGDNLRNNGNYGWTVQKLSESRMLSQTPGITQQMSMAHFAFKTGDAANWYSYVDHFGGWDDNGGEGVTGATFQANNNPNMWQGTAAETVTGPATLNMATFHDYALVGGYVRNDDRPTVSGNIIGETVQALGGRGFVDILQTSAPVLTPSTFIGTNPSVIDIGAPNAANGVVKTVTLTGTGTINVGQLLIFGCEEYPVFVKPTAVTGGGGTWQITGTFYRGCSAGGEVWQGGTHGLLNLPWVDHVIHEGPNQATWSSDWLVGGATDSTHMHLYYYNAGYAVAPLREWGQDFGHSYYVVGLLRTANVARVCPVSGVWSNQAITISGATDSSFNGAFTTGAYDGTNQCVSWSNPGPDVTSPAQGYFNTGGAAGGAAGRGAFKIYPGAMVKQSIPIATTTNGVTSLAPSGNLALFDNDMPVVAGDHMIALQDMASKGTSFVAGATYSTPPTAGLQNGFATWVTGPGVQTDLFFGRRLSNFNNWEFYANGGASNHGAGATADYIEGPWSRIHYTSGPLPGGIVDEVDRSGSVYLGVHGDYIDRVNRDHTGNYGREARYDPWNSTYTVTLYNADTLQHSQYKQSGNDHQFFGKINVSDGSGYGGGFTANEGAAAAGASGFDALWADQITHALMMNNNNTGAVKISGTIASGSTALGTSTISSGACATVVTATATGVVSTDTIAWNPNASIKAVTGYTPATTGGLSIAAFPSADLVSFDVCNWSNASITPGAVTVNWRVAR